MSLSPARVGTGNWMNGDALRLGQQGVTHLAATLVYAVAGAALLLTLTPSPALASKRLSLQEANRRWRGARCRSLQEISVKGGQDRHGVSKSRWLFWDKHGGNHRARLYIENADALVPRFGRQIVPAGTELRAIGWGEVKPGGSVFLEVEVADLPVKAKLFYWDDWIGKVTEKRLDQFERWVRFEVFQILETPDEKIVDVPRSGGRSSGAATAVPPPVPRPDVTKGSMGLRVLAASVEPVRVAPGDQVRLVITYAVDGVAAGITLAVTERRTILQRGVPLTTVEEVVRRPAGVHQSRQPMQIPAGLAAGVYELQVTVRAPGVLGEGSAVFEVTNGAR